jgi:hypothetical protein
MFSIAKRLDDNTVNNILSLVENARLEEDVSSYAKGRQKTWINLNWDLRDKKFSTSNCMYADYESVGIQLTGTCRFDYMGGYTEFRHGQREAEHMQSYELLPGDVYRFNCKNRHAAAPSAGRYAINLWKISGRFRKEYEEAIRTPNITTLF